MDVRTDVLLVIVGMALVTYIPRMFPLVVLSRFTLPPLVLRWLAYVPVAVLTAFVAQEVLLQKGAVALPPANPALLAALPAFAVAAYTRNLMATVVTGIAATALLRMFLGS